jgi:hypothetical protein
MSRNGGGGEVANLIFGLLIDFAKGMNGHLLIGIFIKV